MVRKTNYDYDDRSDDEDFQIGDEVEIHGLQGAKELNGRTGRIVAYVEETQRFGVKLDGELENKAVRPVNLRRLDEENGASERALLEAQLAQVVEQLKAAEESGEDKSLYQRMLAELIRKLKDIDEMTEARAKQRAAAAANAAAAAAEEAAERAKKTQEERPVLGPKPPGASKAPEGLRPPPLPREQHHPLPPKQQREKVVSDAKLELRPPAPRPGPPPVLPQRSVGKLIPPKPSKPMYTDEHEYPDPTRAFQAGRVFAGSILCGIIASQADLFPATWFVWTFLTVHLVGVAFLTDYAGQSGLVALCATFGLHAGFALSEFALWMLGLVVPIQSAPGRSWFSFVAYCIFTPSGWNPRCCRQITSPAFRCFSRCFPRLTRPLHVVALSSSLNGDGFQTTSSGHPSPCLELRCVLPARR